MSHKIAIVLLIGCCLWLTNCKQPFERETELISYLEAVHHLDLSERQVVVLLQTNFCGACTDEVKQFLLDYMKAIEFKKTIILSKESEKTRAFLNQIKDFNVNILVDPDFKIESYGLKYSSDLLGIIEDQQLVSWAFLTENQLRKLKQ